MIADFDVAEKMLNYFIRKVHRRQSLVHPRIVLTVHSEITQVERRAVRDSAREAGARERGPRRAPARRVITAA